MLLIDGVKYQLWPPKDEGEFTPHINEHAKEIFGEGSLYFGDLKRKIKSPAGAASIPDGWAVGLGMPLKSYVVEIEHSSHDVYGHISPQIDKIMAGLKNPTMQHQIVDAIYDDINRNAARLAEVKEKIGSQDLHKLLSDSISKQQPELVILIDEASDQLRECIESKSPAPILREFATYQRGGVGLAVHAHLFEPLVAAAPTPPAPVTIQRIEEPRLATVYPSIPPQPLLGSRIEVILPGALWWKTYRKIPCGAKNRSFFPGFKLPFLIETDIGNVTTRVVSGRGGKRGATDKMGDPKWGDPKLGGHIGKKMKPWFDAHTELKPGDKLIIEAIEPHKRYRLSIVQS